MTIIDRTSFRAANARDPELASELLAERRREANRRAEWLHAQRRLEGLAGEPQTPFVELTEAELLDRALDAVAARHAFRASPEGRFLTALEEIGEVLALASAALDEARAARSRGFEDERSCCRRKADVLVELARRLRSTALDASLAVSRTF
jgi:hypothetical protein